MYVMYENNIIIVFLMFRMKESDSEWLSLTGFVSLFYTLARYNLQAMLEKCQAAPPGFGPGTLCLPWQMR